MLNKINTTGKIPLKTIGAKVEISLYSWVNEKATRENQNVSDIVRDALYQQKLAEDLLHETEIQKNENIELTVKEHLNYSNEVAVKNENSNDFAIWLKNKSEQSKKEAELFGNIFGAFAVLAISAAQNK